MHSKTISDEAEIISDEGDEATKKLFDSPKSRHQNNLESMKSSELVLDYIQLLYYKCHKINMNSGGSYIDSSDWIKNKKATKNPINEKDNNIITYSTL